VLADVEEEKVEPNQTLLGLREGWGGVDAFGSHIVQATDEDSQVVEFGP
jgi:hypothetical protein